MLARAVLLLASAVALCHAQAFYCCVFINPQFGFAPSFATCSATGCGGNGPTRLQYGGFYMVDDCGDCNTNLTAAAVNRTVSGPSVVQPSAIDALASASDAMLTELFCCVNYIGKGVYETYVSIGGCANYTGFGDAYGFVQNATSCTTFEAPPAAPLYCCLYSGESSITTGDRNSTALVSTGGCPMTQALNNTCGGMGGLRTCTLNSFYLIDAAPDCVTTIDCTQYNGDCMSCSNKPGCGYCFADNTCRAGNTSMPFSGPTCTAPANFGGTTVDMWTYGYNTCQVGPCLTTIYDTCQNCNQIPGCGYCNGDVTGIGSAQECLWGNATGPEYAQCSAYTDRMVNYNPWMFGINPGLCPENLCAYRGTNNCSSCTGDDGLCSACWDLQGEVQCIPWTRNACPGTGGVGVFPMALDKAGCEAAETCRAQTHCYDCFSVNMSCGWCDNQGGCWAPYSLGPATGRGGTGCTLLCPTNMTCEWPANHAYAGCAGPTSTTDNALTASSGATSTTGDVIGAPKSHAGAIVGGILGGLAAVAVIGGVLYWRSRRNASSRREHAPLMGRS